MLHFFQQRIVAIKQFLHCLFITLLGQQKGVFLNIPILFFLHCFANFVTGAVTAAPDRTGINSQLSSRIRN